MPLHIFDEPSDRELIRRARLITTFNFRIARHPSKNA
jgi:hypothetical protein